MWTWVWWALEVPPGICVADRPCVPVQTFPAGSSPSGVAMEVIEVAHTAPSTDEMPSSEDCPHRSFWRTGGGLPAQSFLALCNDGYGASGVGEDNVTVGENRLSISRYGGSAWRWASEWTVQLAPPRLLSTRTDSFHAAAPEHTSVQTADLVRGEWRTTWSSPVCGGDEHSFLSIPTWEGDVPNARLGTCAAHVTADATSGFVPFGGLGLASDARFDALLVGETTLVIDIADDVVVPVASNWIHADHIELWLSPQWSDAHMDWECETPNRSQWGLLWDGSVVPGVGASGVPPTTRIAHFPQYTRVVVTLPPDWHGITVVFSDSDTVDSPKQERLLATSPVSMKQAHSLGGVARLQATTCAVEETPEGPRFNLTPNLEAVLTATGDLTGG